MFSNIQRQSIHQFFPVRIAFGMGSSIILSLSLLFLTFTLSSAATCSRADVTALNAFKNSFPANTFPNSWDGSDNCCFYDGVGCDKQGRVTSLFFTSDQEDFDHLPVVLKGTLPPSVGDLSALESISISSQPNLVGPIPNNWAKLKNMQYFTIYNTSVSGPVPSFLSQYTKLIELEINYCKLTGTIPASLGNLANLQVIALDDNSLTGTIPGSLFSKLKSAGQAELGLSNNNLTGAIPQSFAAIKWKNLDVSNNMLCGPIPSGGSYVPADGSGFANNKCLCGPPLPACK